MTDLINAVSKVVPEALAGFAVLQPGVALLEGRNVMVRADRVVTEENRDELPVALISGGGSGHEPAHAGYVAEGMLTAAVAGEIFSSPSVDAVLDAIRAVTGTAGCLLIVKSYTGDRLNFGLAAEIARSEGLKVEMVVVGDDAALGDSDSHAGRRGLAGTVFVHKIAGALAESGASLEDVAARARKIAGKVRTMGVGASQLTIPGVSEPSFTLPEGRLEMGLGIHGEHGVEQVDFTSAAQTAEHVIERLLADYPEQPNRAAVLLGNAGGTSVLEMGILAGAVRTALESRGVTVSHLFQGPVMTSLSLRGFSVSVLPLGEPGECTGEKLLLEPTTSLAWPGHAAGVSAPVTIPVPDVAADRDAGEPDPQIRAAIDAACARLLEKEAELTERDQRVGDGDLGTALARGAHAWQNNPLEGSASAMLRHLSELVRREVGGTSGPLYAIGLLTASEALEKGASWDEAFRAAVDALMELGGAKPGDKTMIDALDPAAEAAAQGIGAAVEAARTGVESSSASQASKGRASYLGERAAGEADPGAVAVVYWLEAVAETRER